MIFLLAAGNPLPPIERIGGKASNLARLAVLAQQLQKNATLQAARPDRSPPAEESELEAGMGRFTSAEPVPWGA